MGGSIDAGNRFTTHNGKREVYTQNVEDAEHYLCEFFHDNVAWEKYLLGIGPLSQNPAHSVNYFIDMENKIDFRKEQTVFEKEHDDLLYDVAKSYGGLQKWERLTKPKTGRR